MPFRTLDLDEVAEYLHLSRSDVEEYVKTRTIPYQNRGGRIVFIRGEIDAWASQRILGMGDKRLEVYHQKSTRGSRAILENDALMPELLKPGYISPAMGSRTRRSIIHDMVGLAEKTGRVQDPAGFLSNVEAREDMCSTALPGGMALLHSRQHEEYQFDGSFVLLGRTTQGLPFGAPDGHPTWYFFLLCCQDEHLHLHTLARLCMMAHKTDMIPRLFDAASADEMYEVVVASEEAALAGKKHIEASSPSDEE